MTVHPIPNDIRFKDLAGKRFGKLTVQNFAGRNKHQHTCWNCLCDCGACTIVPGMRLSNSHTTSCGCYKAEKTRQVSTTHGMTNSREYTVYRGMLARCYNANDPVFPRWGGRGIIVCDRWRESFENFFADMGEVPSLKHSIDRIDNDGPYCKENCRWATAKEQAINRRTTRNYTHNGETHCIKEWAEKTGILYHTLYARLIVHGLSFERAIST